MSEDAQSFTAAHFVLAPDGRKCMKCFMLYPILQDILGNDHRYGPLSDVSNVVSAQRVAKTVCLVTENFGQRVDEAADLLSQMGLQS